MPNNVKQSSQANTESDVEELLAMREDVLHDTLPLQQTIIANSVSIPQKLEVRETGQSSSSRGSLWGRVLLVGACLAVFGIAVTALFPATPPSQSELDSLSAAELDYHELMIIQDELLFAQL